jgi:hypothetical protein
MVIDAQAIPLRVAVREQPDVQQMVRQESDARHCVNRRERRHDVLSRSTSDPAIHGSDYTNTYRIAVVD